MPTLFQHTRGSDRAGAAAASGPGSRRIDWQAARRAERACCCPGKPAVVVVMPPVPGRPYPVDLLLCGHHYRVSARALEAAGAGVFGTDGRPLPDAVRGLARTGR